MKIKQTMSYKEIVTCYFWSIESKRVFGVPEAIQSIRYTVYSSKSERALLASVPAHRMSFSWYWSFECTHINTTRDIIILKNKNMRKYEDSCYVRIEIFQDYAPTYSVMDNNSEFTGHCTTLGINDSEAIHLSAVLKDKGLCISQNSNNFWLAGRSWLSSLQGTDRK